MARLPTLGPWLALGLTACVAPPSAGTWDVPAPVVQDDACHLYDQTAPTASTVALVIEGPSTFGLTLTDDGELTPCRLQGNRFDCDATEEIVDLVLVQVQVERTLTGRFVDPWHATGTISAGVVCDGGLCGLADVLGVTLPCVTTLGWSATHR